MIKHIINKRGDFEDIEVGFVDGLFEMYKLRELIAKTSTKAEIISDGKRLQTQIWYQFVHEQHHTQICTN